jgi:hypothetical protein
MEETKEPCFIMEKDGEDIKGHIYGNPIQLAALFLAAIKQNPRVGVAMEIALGTYKSDK